MHISNTNNKITHIISFLERNERIVILNLSAIVIITGLIYSISLGNTLRYPDEKEYYSIASNIVTNGSYSLDGIHPTTYRPPAYPLFLSLFLFIGFKIIHLRILNFIMLAGSMFLLYKVVQKHSSTIAGLISVFLIMFYPVLFYSAGTLYPQTFGSFLLMIFVYYIFFNERYSNKRSILAGLAIGILMLSISTFVFVFVVTLLFLIFHRRDFKTASLVILVSCIVVAPWVARNYLVLNAFVPFSTNSGINLLLGNSPNTMPNSGVNVDLSMYSSRTSSMSEIQKDTYYRSEAIRFITENKEKAVTLYVKKVLNYFNYRNELATKMEASASRDLLMLFTYAPLFFLFVFRICLFKKYPLSNIEIYFVIVYILNACFQAIFFTRIRYRLPYDFLLIGLVSIFLSNVLKRPSRVGIVKSLDTHLRTTSTHAFRSSTDWSVDTLSP
jgi:4-amino-4-deoxy-L-arabinose transferase-like glycosyltransferase